MADVQAIRSRRLEIDIDVPPWVHHAAEPAASSAMSVDRWPSPSILYWVTRTGGVYIGEGHARLAAARGSQIPDPTGDPA
jgi:hypothetical protein